MTPAFLFEVNMNTKFEFNDTLYQKLYDYITCKQDSDPLNHNDLIAIYNYIESQKKETERLKDNLEKTKSVIKQIAERYNLVINIQHIID